MAEVLVEQKFMEKQKAAEYESEILRIQQQMVKAKAHAKILEEVNEEGEENASKNFLHVEDGSIPLQQQKGMNILNWPLN